MNSGGAMTSYRVRLRYADASIGPRLRRRKPRTAGPAISQNQRVWALGPWVVGRGSWVGRGRRKRNHPLPTTPDQRFPPAGAEDGDEAVGAAGRASAGFANVELLVEHSVDIRLD